MTRVMTTGKKVMAIRTMTVTTMAKNVTAIRTMRTAKKAMAIRTTRATMMAKKGDGD
jgi:hypothetical protein